MSTDPQFIEKVRDIVGLYLDPPDKALVLGVDEKSQMQALGRRSIRVLMASVASAPIATAPAPRAVTECRVAVETKKSSTVTHCPARSRPCPHRNAPGWCPPIRPGTGPPPPQEARPGSSVHNERRGVRRRLGRPLSVRPCTFRA